MLDWNDYLKMLAGLLAVVGPIDSIPLFLAFTDNLRDKRGRVARTCGLTVALILALSVLFGAGVLYLFDISLPGFQVAGGLLLLVIAFEMLQARIGRVKHTPEEDREAIDSLEVAVVPLALPLLAGPGAISTVILFSEQSPALAHKLILVGIACLLGLSVWLSFALAPRIARRLSQSAMNIMTRVMGLIVAAVAVEFITGGLRELLPGLG